MTVSSPPTLSILAFALALLGLAACAGTRPETPTAHFAAKPSTADLVVEVVAQGPDALAAPAPRGGHAEHHLDQLASCAGYADFHRCVIERLTEVLADDPSHADLAVLIQSYQLTGQSEEAFARIVEYLRRFPEGPHVDRYAGARPTGVSWDAVNR
jgi:hypothetical protein